MKRNDFLKKTAVGGCALAIGIKPPISEQEELDKRLHESFVFFKKLADDHTN